MRLGKNPYPSHHSMGVEAPITRLWLQSMTEGAIKEAQRGVNHQTILTAGDVLIPVQRLIGLLG